MTRDLRALPKAHLHVHLEGSARPSTIQELGRRNGNDLADLMQFADLTEFVDRYAQAVGTVTAPEDLERICYELLMDEAGEGVRWCEPMLTPQFYEGLFGSLDDVWELMKAGFNRAEAETGIRWGVIVGHVRTMDVELAERMAVWATRHVGDGVVGFGIAGDEQLAGPQPFARAFAIARDAGLLCVPHAGETVGPESIEAALAVGADRIAHGVRSVESPDLLRRLADEGITCDVCPTSNVMLSVVETMGEHPLPAMLAANVPITLNADDQLFFGSLVASEYEIARQAFGLTDDELAAIARTSASASGAPADLKADMQAAIDRWLSSSEE